MCFHSIPISLQSKQWLLIFNISPIHLLVCINPNTYFPIKYKIHPFIVQIELVTVPLIVSFKFVMDT